MRLLITAFEPFGGEAVNAAEKAVSALPEQIGSWQMIKRIVPTAFFAAGDAVITAIEQTQPDVVLCIGQAAGRRAVTPERLAVNCMDARIPDNTGFQPEERPIVPDGPAAYFSTLPVKKLAEAICAADLPGEVSNSAGLFVCNALYYHVLHFAAQCRPQLRACFLHVPAMPEQMAEGQPSLTAEESARALKAAILAIPTP